MILKVFSRRWLLASVLVLAAAAVMVRLGFWQLDRLEWRKSFNARVEEQIAAAPLELNASNLNADLYAMEYRRVTVVGHYLPDDEIVLRNQVWTTEFGTELGVSLFTPLLIEGTDSAILIERGWIPQEDADRKSRATYQENGLIEVSGRLRRAETDFGINEWLHPDLTLAPDQQRLDIWNNLNLERIAGQMETQLLPVYLQLQPESNQFDPPYAGWTSPDLSEGSHFGYAIQWFTFATILVVGYPFYVNRQESKTK
jgi:surfeit locus 1 family protein